LRQRREPLQRESFEKKYLVMLFIKLTQIRNCDYARFSSSESKLKVQNYSSLYFVYSFESNKNVKKKFYSIRGTGKNLHSRKSIEALRLLL
jgi:hypothetical protein